MQKISTIDMSRDEWRAARRIGIGGSDVASIMGLNPYRSPMAVYLDKIGEVIQPDLTSEAVYWGNTLEDVVARHYADANGVKVQRNNHILMREDMPFMIANIDREVISPTEGRFGFEAKTTDARNSRQWDDDMVPIPYVLQVQHYMAVTQFPFFDVGCLIGGNHFVQRRINYDTELVESMIERERDFWRMVETKTPPAWDGSQSAWDVLRLMYPDSKEGKTIQLPSDLMEDFTKLNALNRQSNDYKNLMKDTDKQKDIYKQKICAALGDAEVGILGDFEISYKTVRKKEHVVKESQYRMFKIKEIKEEAA